MLKIIKRFQHIAECGSLDPTGAKGKGKKTPANTGNDKTKRKAVINTDHTKSGKWCILKPGARMLKIVVIKFIAPKIEEIPAKCRLNIAKSTAADEWLWILLKGG